MWIVEGKYRLLRQTSRWARFAQVTVHGAVATGPEVRMGPDVFAWRVRPYGAALGAGRADDRRIQAEAREGAWYALMRLPEEARGVLVSVVEIVTAPADTGPGDVKFAAAQAVWQAVGRRPDQYPWIGEDGNPVFP
ncbi:hypothetical protein [Kitasatospora cathayae]|uniref:Uncharacterized protein n=1 Tax=Kitasatospora cathayae TaxID=3004092 RepID=A0ABY7QAA6_9ACTN|nr:hypothetical protein [Kitasatospora sp. HUAS 3-15]WBP89607.1 hypothetical protein O1G21_29690 [Kitasatospora sp. HUAS 3-15]